MHMGLQGAYRKFSGTCGWSPNFLGHLAHRFHGVTVFFRIFTIPLRDQPFNFCALYPILDVLLWPLSIHTHSR
jgi:hypothetical protein